MKNTKLKKTPLKPLALASASLSKKVAVKSPVKILVPSEATEAHERIEWRKEKREYWSGRFRKVLAEIAVKPKAKKSSFF